MYHPLVHAVIRVAVLSEEGNGVAELGDDPPAVLIDALYIYTVARNSTRSRTMKRRIEEMKKKS